MEEKELEKLQKLAEQKRKQLDRQNKYMRDKYDRIALMMPKGMREVINNRAKEKGYKTITDYLKALVEKDINTAAAPDVVADHEQIKPLVLECPEIKSDYDILDTYRPIRTPEELAKPTETLEERLERLKKEFGTPEE